jgi:glycosyltransferase involved in cell wall biosynthesis
MFEPINQIARARNRGAEAATGDWLLFIDADSQPSKELLADVATEIKAGRCIAGGSTVKMQGDHPVANFVGGLWNRISRYRKLLAGSFIFCEAETFRMIGGFNNELFAAEELDLSVRLQKLGAETGREIVILHRYPLLTSDRKMRLYSWREHMRLIMRTVFNHRKALRDREACHLWYDGRR